MINETDLTLYLLEADSHVPDCPRCKAPAFPIGDLARFMLGAEQAFACSGCGYTFLGVSL